MIPQTFDLRSYFDFEFYTLKDIDQNNIYSPPGHGPIIPIDNMEYLFNNLPYAHKFKIVYKVFSYIKRARSKLLSKLLLGQLSYSDLLVILAKIEEPDKSTNKLIYLNKYIYMHSSKRFHSSDSRTIIINGNYYSYSNNIVYCCCGDINCPITSSVFYIEEKDFEKYGVICNKKFIQHPCRTKFANTITLTNSFKTSIYLKRDKIEALQQQLFRKFNGDIDKNKIRIFSRHFNNYLKTEFSKLKGGEVSFDSLISIEAIKCGIPLYWSCSRFLLSYLVLNAAISFHRKDLNTSNINKNISIRNTVKQLRSIKFDEDIFFTYTPI